MMSYLKSVEREITINCVWGKIAGLSWGNPSNRPVLFCHGRQDACTSFRPLVARLPRDFYYVSIDLPGNGRSDHLPKGLRYSVADLVPAIKTVVEHFEWKKLIYVGHSLGVPIGKLFNIAYPGLITRTVELDPIPAHHNFQTTREGLRDWYLSYYDFYDKNNYEKLNGTIETAPKYTYEKALQLTMVTRGINKEACESILERCLEPAGDGLYRFTFDQRIKQVTVLPFSGELLKRIYTTTKTPTFCVLATQIIDMGVYDNVPFVRDPSAWPNIKYRYKIVEGGHDVHIDRPDLMADDISQFLIEDFKANL